MPSFIELGARVVKTYYWKENFEKAVDGCPVPVVMAGGPKTETQKEVFDFVYDGIQEALLVLIWVETFGKLNAPSPQSEA